MLRWHPLEDRRGTKKSLELIGGAFRWLVLVNHNLKFKGWVHYNNSGYLRITKICGAISGKYRVWGPLSNSPDFVAAYNCPVGSNMNRDDKCVLW